VQEFCAAPRTFIRAQRLSTACAAGGSGRCKRPLEAGVGLARLDHAKRVLKYEIMGLIMLVLAVVTLGGFGAVGQALDDLCVMLAGNWHFLIPLYVLYAAVLIMARRNRLRFTLFQTGLAMILFTIVTWSELALYTQAVQVYGPQADLLRVTRDGIASLERSLRQLVVATATGQVLPPASAGGGMIGFAVFTGLKYMFAVTGTLLVLIVAVIVGFILMTRRSLVASIERGASYFEKHLDQGWARAMHSLASVLTVRARRARAQAERAQSLAVSGGRPVGRRAQSGDEDDADGRQVAGGGEPGADGSGSGRRRSRRKPAVGALAGTVSVPAAGFAADDDGPADGAAAPFALPNAGANFPLNPTFEDFLTGVSVADASTRTPDEQSDPDEIVIDGDRLALGREPVLVLDTARARVTARVPVRSTGALASDPPVVSSVASSLQGGGSADVTVPPYRLPDARLLDRGEHGRGQAATADRELQANAQKLVETLDSFGVSVRVIGFSRGPAVTRYEIQPATGVKVSRILSLADDLALSLAARDIRIEAPIPGKAAIGIEVPNREISLVTFREVIETASFTRASSLLTVALGKDIAGNAVVADLAKMPHLLVAGATGAGKSVCINVIIASILFRARPTEVKFILIDPKMVELGAYAGIPHLFAPVVTEPRRAAAALRKVTVEMERRYELFHTAKVRDLERYNAWAAQHGKPLLPLLVVVIDELADLMMVAQHDVETAIARLTQMARASGIHLVVATQRPSVDVITGLIKSNIPSRIAFAVSSAIDSRTILDTGGAEKLLGRGDMLYLPVGAAKSVRVQGAFLSAAELERLVAFTSTQQQVEYLDDFSQLDVDKKESMDDLDALYDDAVRTVVEAGQASVSFLQRRLNIGYPRAARLIDSLERTRVIGPYDSSKPREVLLSRTQLLAQEQAGAREDGQGAEASEPDGGS
jgi:S-DNA-T family DNA segregation ATPase FtsK/SpoIIIE